MAHIAKYKASAVGKLCAHYNRWQGIDNPNVSRENIDKSRTHLNYTLGVYEKDGKRFIGKVRGSASWATVKGRIDAVNARAKAEGKRATRKDAVVMADMVVTLPPNVPPEDAYKFFWNSYQYIADRVGRGNLMGGYVHMDETTPHMHVPFTPILDGRFNYKKMCDRKFYQTFHKGLGDRLEQKMGYRPEVELSDETRAQRVYTSRTKDIDKVRGAVDRAVVQPAEDEAARIVADATERAERASAARKRDEDRLRAARSDLAKVERQRVETRGELGALTEQVGEKRSQAAEMDRKIAEKMAELDRLDGEIGEKIELRNEVGDNLQREQRRLESVRQAAGRLDEDVEELEAIASLAERFDHAGRFEKRGILDEIAARCDGLRGRVSQFVEEVREAVGRLEVAIADLARRLAPRSARMTTRALKRDLAALERDYGEDDDRSPKARAAEAQRAAMARDANRDDRPPQRSWSQSR